MKRLFAILAAVLLAPSVALAQDDLSIHTASDAETGLDLIYDLHPHIVLTDLVMPAMSGAPTLVPPLTPHCRLASRSCVLMLRYGWPLFNLL